MRGYPPVFFWIAALLILLSSTVDAAENNTVEVTLCLHSMKPNHKWIENCENPQATAELFALFKSFFNDTRISGLLRNATCSYIGKIDTSYAALVKLELDAVGYSKINATKGNKHREQFASLVAKGMEEQGFDFYVLYVLYPTPQRFTRFILDGAMAKNWVPIKWSVEILEKKQLRALKIKGQKQINVATMIFKSIKFDRINLAYVYPHNNQVYARFLLQTPNYRIAREDVRQEFANHIANLVDDAPACGRIRLLHPHVQMFRGTWKRGRKTALTTAPRKNQRGIKIVLRAPVVYISEEIPYSRFTNENSVHYLKSWESVDKQLYRVRHKLQFQPTNTLNYLDHYAEYNNKAAIEVFFFANPSSAPFKQNEKTIEELIRENIQKRAFEDGLDAKDLNVTIIRSKDVE